MLQCAGNVRDWDHQFGSAVRVLLPVALSYVLSSLCRTVVSTGAPSEPLSLNGGSRRAGREFVGGRVVRGRGRGRRTGSQSGDTAQARAKRSIASRNRREREGARNLVLRVGQQRLVSAAAKPRDAGGAGSPGRKTLKPWGRKIHAAHSGPRPTGSLIVRLCLSALFHVLSRTVSCH